jgi:hypothetical protein
VIRRVPKLESLFVATLVLFGFRLGIRPISDNSMLTHIRTGIDMVQRGAIPRSDPYSWTAHGTRWVVQSWLPEWTYGLAHRVGGFRLVVLEQGLLMAGLAWLLIRLARAGSPVRTAAAGLIVVGLAFPYWSPRPLLFGLICMALMVTVVERRRTTWLLVPIVWLWVQSHGSYPLGLVWLGARAVGEGLDWRAWPRDALSYIGAFVAGMVASVVNPLGARLLVFPLTVGGRQEIFKRIVEWMSPNFQSGPGRIALIFLVVALLLLVRARLIWRDVVPVVVFLAAGLFASRNLPLAAIAFAPALGRTLRRPESAPARRSPGADQDRINRALALVLTLGFVLFGASVLRTGPLSLERYPVDAATALAQQGFLDGTHNIVHMDFVGNYLELRFGRQVPVFIDDRYDMYPTAVSHDYIELLAAGPRSLRILDDRHVEVVLWHKDDPLAVLLTTSGRWRQTQAFGEWVVLERAL